MKVDPSLPLVLEYTDPSFQGGLFVAADIIDYSGGSPVLVAQVPLPARTNSRYAAKYTFTAGKTYLVQKSVYTDGTYAVLDTNFPGTTESIQCVASVPKVVGLDFDIDIS